MARRLAAFLASDVGEYSRQMFANEEGTIAALKSHTNYQSNRKCGGETR